MQQLNLPFLLLIYSLISYFMRGEFKVSLLYISYF